MSAALVKRVRWTVDKYFRMSEAGFLDDQRVELLNGEIIEIPAQSDPHQLVISRIFRLSCQAFDPSAFWVVCQGTLRLSRFDAPDPDLHIFDFPEGTFPDPRPRPIVMVEVSDTTYSKDGRLKLRTYARTGVEEYWIVNIPQGRLEVYRQPENPTGRRSGWHYASVTHLTRGQQVTLLKRPSITFAVDAMLP